jgi:AAA+ superfamily predicted ATPase
MLTKHEKFAMNRELYDQRVESLHFASIMSDALRKHGWEKFTFSNSYFPIIQKAIELANDGVIESKEMGDVFDFNISRITEKGRNSGWLFKLVVFEEYGMAYLYGQDYVGDELDFYAVKEGYTFDQFYKEIQGKYDSWQKEKNKHKITMYILERNSPTIKHVSIERVTADDMIVNHDIMNGLKSDLSTFFEDADKFKQFNISHRRGILLHGPPGTGKTMLIKHIATTTDVPVVQLIATAGTDTSDLLAFFEYLSEISPAIAIIEDLDSMFKGDMGRSNFLNILDGACTDKNKSLLIIATTNHIKEIDEALTERPSRFDRHYHLDYPDEDLRRQYIVKRFANLKSLVENDAAVGVFVKNTERMSYAHLNEIYTQAALKAINCKRDELTENDINEAIRTVRNETTKASSTKGFNTPSIAPVRFGERRPYVEDDD